MAHLVRVVPRSGSVGIDLTPTREVMATGLASIGSTLWLVDTKNGLLLRLP